jgi:hypothetical protein
VQLATVEHSQFKVPVERRGVYGLPLDLFQIIFPPGGFIDEQLHSLPKLVAPSQLQPALFKAKVLGTEFFVLNSLGLTSAFFGALVTLAEYFTEILKQRFLPSEAASILGSDRSTK